MNPVHAIGAGWSRTVRELGWSDFPHLRMLDEEARRTIELAGLVVALRPPGSFEAMCVVSMREKVLFGIDAPEGGILAGYLAASLTDDWLHVEEVAVGLQRRRQGLGTALMMHAIEVSRRRRLIGCSLTTDRFLPFNYDFYRTLGFTECTSPNQPPHLKRRVAFEEGIFECTGRRVAMVLWNEQRAPAMNEANG